MAPTPPSGSSPSASVLGIVSRVAFARECILKHLASELDVRPVDLGEGGAETLERTRMADPDLILIDLPPAEAGPLVERLLELVPGTRPVAVHDSLGTDGLLRLAETGFVGFVSTRCGVQDLMRELRAVARNETSCSPQLAGALIRSLQRQRAYGEQPREDRLAVLSARERQVAQLLERRYSNKEIASELGIEFGTVKNHVHNILTKLGLHNRWELPDYRPATAAEPLRPGPGGSGEVTS